MRGRPRVSKRSFSLIPPYGQSASASCQSNTQIIVAERGSDFNKEAVNKRK